MVSLIVSMLPSVSVAAAASKLLITSPVISDGATIPTQFTCSGAGQSPPLSFSGVPPGTKSLALLVEDPDAPAGTFVHWIVYDVTRFSGLQGRSVGREKRRQWRRFWYKLLCWAPIRHQGNLITIISNCLRWIPIPTWELLQTPVRYQRETEGHVIQSAELVGIFGR